MDAKVLEMAKSWAKNPHLDTKSIDQINELLQNNDVKELTERFYKELEFGTGGMRALLGAGSNRINQFTIRKATQALANTLKSSFNSSGPLSVAIAYDSRHFSREFAQEVCRVLCANKIHSYLYDRLNPVALLSWAIRHHKTNAGIMITASHNPPDYNGYKVYWSDGAQVTPPHDINIMEAYRSLTDFDSIQTMSFEQAKQSRYFHSIGAETEEAYYQMLLEQALNLPMCKESGNQISIAFTPIHGTGGHPAQKIYSLMGFDNLHLVKEQLAPDPHFPTVKGPNPEDPEAMQKVVELMKEVHADVAFGTDPDTDRLGVVVNQNGEAIFLSGNQIGLLMLHYYLTHKKIEKNHYFIKTIVTSKLQSAVAQHFGVTVYETLTGFKWICKKIKELEDSPKDHQFLFANEESFGYMPHHNVRDKDAVSSLAVMAEVALFYKLKRKTLLDALDDIYDEFGFSDEKLICLHYHGQEGAKKIERIMDKFRNHHGEYLFGEKILCIEDYLKRKKVYSPGREEPIDIEKSNVLGFSFESGNTIYLRPSGTEPKIKFYIMICEKKGSLQDKKEAATKRAQHYSDNIKSFCKDV